jgi:hypothetical protein
MRKPLAVLIPTRGRPGNIEKVISAWDFTNAWDHADMIVIADEDDPEIGRYAELEREFNAEAPNGSTAFSLIGMAKWMPMVHKLNDIAVKLAPHYDALAFAGDDHLPQTIGWAHRYVEVLGELGTGMVYGDDGYQGRKLSTEWAVTSDAVIALGRMVPADVEHMYCDNSMMDLFGGAGAMRHLPEIRIEHMHPIVGKAETDAQYQRVNHRDQFKRDRRAYESWRHGDVFRTDVAEIRHLRRGRPEVKESTTPGRPRLAGSAPRRVERSGPTRHKAIQAPQRNRPPSEFKNVQAATPEDIMMALADFATQVPADQEIVELGVFMGRTALMMAWGARQGSGAHITAVDAWDLPGNTYDAPFTDPETPRWAAHWVSTLGYDSDVTLVKAFAHEIATDWKNWNGKPVGLLFVDDDHSAEGARRAIETWAPHLAPGARIAVDDYGHPDWPGVAEAVDAMVSEGVLEPIEIFHDRLAVTRLTSTVENADAVIKLTGGKKWTEPRITAITSDGVWPSPNRRPGLAWDTAGDDDDLPSEFRPSAEAAEEKVPEIDRAALEAEWERVDPDGVAALRELAAKFDGVVSRRGYVQPGEERVAEVELPGTPIEDLAIPALKALAKHRGIVLGVRKDKRDLILQALRDGR